MTTNETLPPTATVVVHPLANKEISYFGTWQEWRKKWEATSDLAQLLGLLQFGFDTITEDTVDNEDRIRFYLDVADGHGGIDNFGAYDPSRPDVQDQWFNAMTERKRKKVIAKKAFNVLCVRFFKNQNTKHGHPSWAILIVRMPKIFSSLVWFFRCDENGIQTRVRNLDYDAADEMDNNWKVAEQFAYDLCEFAYTFRFFGEYAGDNDRTIQKMFLDARPQLVQLLLGLRREDALLSNAFHAGEIEMRELARIALATEYERNHPYSKSRLCTTGEEAYFSGSRAAKVLLLLRARESERTKFEEARELARTIEESQRRLRELTPMPITK